MERWLKAKQDEVWCGKMISGLEAHWDDKKTQDVKTLVASLVVGNSIMDVGCGTGDLFRYLKGVEYLGVDQSLDMLKRAKELNPDAKFIQKNLYQMDDLPKYDTVVCLAVLHHQPDIEPGLSILLKQAKKRVIFSMWINHRDRHSPRQYMGSKGEFVTWYTTDELAKRLRRYKFKVYESIGHIWKDIYCVEMN
jgi:trans-aconitate methyltransferase